MAHINRFKWPIVNYLNKSEIYNCIYSLKKRKSIKFSLLLLLLEKLGRGRYIWKKSKKREKMYEVLLSFAPGGRSKVSLHIKIETKRKRAANRVTLST